MKRYSISKKLYSSSKRIQAPLREAIQSDSKNCILVPMFNVFGLLSLAFHIGLFPTSIIFQQFPFLSFTHQAQDLWPKEEKSRVSAKRQKMNPTFLFLLPFSDTHFPTCHPRRRPKSRPKRRLFSCWRHSGVTNNRVWSISRLFSASFLSFARGKKVAQKAGVFTPAQGIFPQWNWQKRVR